MASIILSSRSSGKLKKLRLEGINLTENVSAFRSKSASSLGMKQEEIDLVYCGRRLQDGKSLESAGVKPGVTIHALKKPVPDNAQEPEKLDKSAVRQVVTALQAALISPAYRHTIGRMLNDQEALENIMAATPGLHSDPVAIAMLQDPEMMALLADPNHVHGLIEAHPVLGHAAMLVAAAVTEEGAKGGSAMAAPSTGTYSMDQMSDEEDLEGAPVSLQQAAAAARQAPQPITASQLMDALAAVSAQPSSQRGESSGGQSSSGSGGGITADLFRQALSHATGTAAQPPAPPSEEETQAQLAQLRDMGITDEAAARQALLVTRGNIQAALELLFGDMS